MKKLVFTVFIMSLLVMAMSTCAFAADTYDMTSAITTTAGELQTQFFAMLSVVMPIVMLIVGGKIMATKGISWFKALIGKA